MIKQYMKGSLHPDRISKAAAQFLLCHTTSVSTFPPVFLLIPTSRGSELNIWGRPCTAWGCSLLKQRPLYGCLLHMGLSVPSQYSLWSKAQQPPRIFWHLEEVTHSVPSSEGTPGVVAQGPMAWQMVHKQLRLSSPHLPYLDTGERDFTDPHPTHLSHARTLLGF